MNPLSNQSLDEDFRTQLQDYGLRYDPITGLPNQTFFRGAFAGAGLVLGGMREAPILTSEREQLFR